MENKTPSLALSQALAQFDFPSGYVRRSVIKRLFKFSPYLFASNDILSTEDRASLMDSFRSENEQLSDICGWDINALFHDSVDFDLESRCAASQQEHDELLGHAKDVVMATVRDLSAKG